MSHLRLLRAPAQTMDPAIRSATIRTGVIASAISIVAFGADEMTGGDAVILKIVGYLTAAVCGLAIARYSQNKGHSCRWGFLALFGPIGGLMAGKLPDRTRRLGAKKDSQLVPSYPSAASSALSE